jgi:hypothetical protein
VCCGIQAALIACDFFRNRSCFLCNWILYTTDRRSKCEGSVSVVTVTPDWRPRNPGSDIR